ncbi:MAG: dihydrodipicolinate synthase family protein [Clostridia bacterium]|nr:dihydrodipicolinate synthase family protein [Clostridia bacterium]
MFKGIIPALVTPIDENGKVLREASKKVIDFEISQGADGFYILGATGEGLVLTEETRKEFAELSVQQVKGRLPIIDHIADMNLPTAIRLAKHAEAIGCDAIASIPPTYFAYTEDDIYNYYKTISDAVHIPVMIYYAPAAGVNMTAKFVKRLFEIENITSVKWSKADYYQMVLLKDMTHGEMNIINGPDEMLLCGLSMGADGGIGSTYNFMLPKIKAIYNAFIESNVPLACKCQREVSRIIAALLNWPCIPGVKKLLKHMGCDVGEASYPMYRFTESEEAKLLAAIREAGLEI